MCMALSVLSRLYGWEKTKAWQKGESWAQKMERILHYRREHLTPLMASVNEIMKALAKKYTVERNGR